MFGGRSWSRTSTAYAAELQSVELTYAQPTQIIQLIVYVVSSQMSRTFLALARGIYKSPFGSSIIDYNLNLGKCQVFLPRNVVFKVIGGHVFCNQLCSITQVKLGRHLCLWTERDKSFESVCFSNHGL